MRKERRAQSVQSQPQKRAIQSLLDCSDTLKAKNSKKNVKSEQQTLCPWMNFNKIPLDELKGNSNMVKTNRIFSKTCHRYQIKPNRQNFNNKTILSTPKTKFILDEIENYNYLSTNALSLTKQIALINKAKKNNHLNNYIRRQLYLRMKTQ